MMALWQRMHGRGITGASRTTACLCLPCFSSRMSCTPSKNTDTAGAPMCFGLFKRSWALMALLSGLEGLMGVCSLLPLSYRRAERQCDACCVCSGTTRRGGACSCPWRPSMPGIWWGAPSRTLYCGYRMCAAQTLWRAGCDCIDVQARCLQVRSCTICQMASREQLHILGAAKLEEKEKSSHQWQG